MEPATEVCVLAQNRIRPMSRCSVHGATPATVGKGGFDEGGHTGQKWSRCAGGSSCQQAAGAQSSACGHRRPHSSVATLEAGQVGTRGREDSMAAAPSSHSVVISGANVVGQVLQASPEMHTLTPRPVATSRERGSHSPKWVGC